MAHVTCGFCKIKYKILVKEILKTILYFFCLIFDVLVLGAKYYNSKSYALEYLIDYVSSDVEKLLQSLKIYIVSFICNYFFKY